MGSIKDRNGLDLTEAKDIKRRWQEYTEELYKKGRNDLDKHSGMVTHCEVKWALGRITMNKASRGDGIPTGLFQILKDDAVKCCTQYASKLGKLNSGHRTGKGVFIPIPKKGNAKECSNYHTVALISYAAK